MSNPFVYQGDEVPWWWPGVVYSDQSRESVTPREALDDVMGFDGLPFANPTPSPDLGSVPLPIAMGVAAVATPYLLGGAIVAFAPPPLKPIGAAMLFPNPAADAVWFGVGYKFGEEVEDWF